MQKSKVIRKITDLGTYTESKGFNKALNELPKIFKNKVFILQGNCFRLRDGREKIIKDKILIRSKDDLALLFYEKCFILKEKDNIISKKECSIISVGINIISTCPKTLEILINRVRTKEEKIEGDLELNRQYQRRLTRRRRKEKKQTEEGKIKDLETTVKLEAELLFEFLNIKRLYEKKLGQRLTNKRFIKFLLENFILQSEQEKNRELRRIKKKHGKKD